MLLLAQLSSDEIGMVRIGIAVFGLLFTGLIAWVAVYMRRGRELVEEHVTEIAVLKVELKAAQDDIRHLREWKHRYGNELQRLVILEEKLERIEEGRPK